MVSVIQHCFVLDLFLIPFSGTDGREYASDRRIPLLPLQHYHAPTNGMTVFIIETNTLITQDTLYPPSKR